MDWDDASRSRLETALNESEVVGVRLDPSEQYVDVLLHVVSLPETGPLVKDGRRLLRLTAPTELQFLLRSEGVAKPDPDRPAIPLADMAAVETFFDSLSWGGSSYGWRFFDDVERTLDWPAEPSLSLRLRDTSASHTFYWFNECGREHDGVTATYCLEGTINFNDLLVLDTGEQEVPLETFIADGVRQWEALFAHDERLSIEAQQEAQRAAPKWRTWAT